MSPEDALSYSLPFIAASLATLSLAVAAFALAFIARTLDEWWRWRK
jgi:hypothetical protein